MKLIKSKNFWSAVMIVLIVAFDQLTKYFAKLYLYGKSAVPFIKGVAELVYAENTGIAFSMLKNGRWFFIITTVALTIVCMYYMYKKAQDRLWLFWSLGVIVSGAIGNLIDRVYLGYVVDFINPTFVNFAVFNIADCAVTLGACSLICFLLYDMFKDMKNNKEEQNDEQ